MKPLESKDPDLFTISVQFLFRICMESSKNSEIGGLTSLKETPSTTNTIRSRN
jgi:hypothetical protein